MINKYFNIIVVVLLVLVLIQGFFSPIEGITPEEEIYRLKIHDLNQEKAQLQAENNELHSQLKNFEDEIIKNDSIIHNSSVEQLDSMFTDYFTR